MVRLAGSITSATSSPPTPLRHSTGAPTVILDMDFLRWLPNLGARPLRTCSSRRAGALRGGVARHAVAVGVPGAKSPAQVDHQRQEQPEPIEAADAADRIPDQAVHQRRYRQEDDAQQRPKPEAAERGEEQLWSSEPDEQNAEAGEQSGEDQEQATHGASAYAQASSTTAQRHDEQRLSRPIAKLTPWTRPQ